MAGGIHASSPGSATVNHQMGHSVLAQDYSVHTQSVIENGVSLNEASNTVGVNTVEGSSSRKRKHSADATNSQLESKRTCIFSQLLSDMIIEKEKYLYLWLLKEYSSTNENDFFNFIDKIKFSNSFLPFSNPLQPKSIYFSTEPETFQKSIPSEVIPVLKTVKILKQESSELPEKLKTDAIKTPISSNPIRSFTPPTTVDATQHIAEKAKQEAQILQRVAELQKLGLWTEKRLPKVQEPTRSKAHWDYVLEELEWLAADFAQERKWKKAAARKRSRMIQKHFQEREAQVQKTAKAAETHKRKIASHLAKLVKSFWNNVEKMLDYKHQTKLKEKRQQALDQHLSFIVDKTERYSTLVAESMNKSALGNLDNSQPHSPVSDVEFEPNQSSSDDEETIEAEEKGDAAENVDHVREVEMLKKESQLSLDDLLDQLPEEYFENVGKPVENANDDDEEYEVEIDDSDDETTLMEEEKIQGAVDYQSEIAELEADNDLSIEELKSKYSVGADFEDLGGTSSRTGSPSNSEPDDFDNASEVENTDEDFNDVEEEIEDEDGDGLKSLLRDSTLENGDINDENADEKIDNVAAIAESIQPKGNTLSSTSVVTKVPFLLKHSLREYQHIGLDWLVTMYEQKLNGILADEMGLGKTIQTISLLAHLASDKENWGPHLIIVPTSVMLNWEMEFKKWCPAFKILTYYGNPKERKLKRAGWTKPNTFHVCITSYKLVLQDHHCFRRKKWQYLILDEAQNIKNFKSQRWQRLLNFDSERRLLLTGTPLQNNLMELWSLMHFLMPNLFSSHREFREWFSNPVTGMIEGNAEYNENIIKRLHKVLRPFLLRRLKCEVEKQLPRKYEHIIMCRLSNRQRYLYDDFMSRAKTKETLQSGNLLSVINVLMQLRKVCNHPNLFEQRPIISPFQMECINFYVPSLVFNALDYAPFRHVDFSALNLRLIDLERELTAWSVYRLKKFRVPRTLIEEIMEAPAEPPPVPRGKLCIRLKTPNDLNNIKVEANVKNNHKIVTFLKSASVSQNSTGPARITVNSGAPIKPGPIHRTILGLGEINSMAVKRKPTDSFINRNSYSIQLKGGKTNIGPPKFTVLKAVALKNTPNSEKTSTNNVISSSTISSITSTAVPGTSSCVEIVSSPKSVNSVPQLVQTAGKQLILTPTSANSTTVKSGHRVILKSGNMSSPVINFIRLPNSAVQMSSGSGATSSGGSSNSSTIILNNSSRTSIEIPQPISSSVGISARVSTGTRSKSEKAKSSLLPEVMAIAEKKKRGRKERLRTMASINDRKSSPYVMFGCDVRNTLKILDKNSQCPPVTDHRYWKCAGHVNCINAQYAKHVHDMCHTLTNALANSVKSIEERIQELSETFSRYIVYVPAVNARKPMMHISHPNPSKAWSLSYMECMLEHDLAPRSESLHQIVSRMSTSFPDSRLIQYDCGKLQTLDTLLRRLKVEQHRVLIFTQMARMLDVLEAFLTFHGHIYLRLDGSTRVDQRQVLMERFNADKRYFCFILSTRSGGIGVNLIGADTVIFYDSDWNPTMDAQAQDRCHRIGQTRDVHIYRLISEKTIEENILKKANQKKLLGDLAIEGGNFTAAYFKSTTIHDLFNVDLDETDPAKRICDVTLESNNSQNIEKSTLNAYENALAVAEDETDVVAAKTAKEEAVAELAEFDENIPLDNDGNDVTAPTEELSKAEQEVNALIEQLTPIERWALQFMETVDSEWAEEQLAAAEAEIEQQKKEWEMERLAIEQADAKSKRFEEDLEEDDHLLTYSAEDAKNQNWIAFDSIECMPLWLPFASFMEAGEHDEVYIDRSLRYLYESVTIPEHLLPPIYYRKEKKKLRLDQPVQDLLCKSPIRIRNRLRETISSATLSVASFEPPKSLFDRPSPVVTKLRQDMRLQKYRGLARSTIANLPGSKPYFPSKTSEPDFVPEWLIHEDYALLYAIQHVQELPLNLSILYPGHMPNWDLVSDLVNQVSRIYRSPLQCKTRFESAILPREEGKLISDPISKKHKKMKGMNQVLSHSKYTRNYKTAQLYLQDGNNAFTQMMNSRFDAIRGVSNRRAPTIKRLPLTTSTKNPKHAQILAECDIDYDRPLTPIEIATRRAQRIIKEKQTQMASAEQSHRQNNVRQQQQQQQVQQQPQPVQQQPLPQQQQQVKTQTQPPTTTQQTQIQQPVILQQIQPQIAPHRTTQVSTTNIVPQQTAVVVNISQSSVISSASPVPIRSLVTRPVNEVIQQQQSTIVIPQSKTATSTTGNLISTGNIQRLIPITQIQSTTVGTVGTARIMNAGAKMSSHVQNVQIYRQQQTVPQHQLKILHPRSKTPVGVVVSSPQQVRQQSSPQQPQQQQRQIVKNVGGTTTAPATRLSEADLTAIIRRQQQLQQQQLQQQHQQKLAPTVIATSNTPTIQAQIITTTQAAVAQNKSGTGVTLPTIKPASGTGANIKATPTTTSQIRQITIQPAQGSRKVQKVMLNATNAQNLSHMLAKNAQGNVTTATQIMNARVIPVNKTFQVVNAAALRTTNTSNVAIETPAGTRYIQQTLPSNAIKLSGSPSTVSVSTLSPQQSFNQLVQNQSLVRQGNLIIQNTGIVSGTITSTSSSAASSPTQIVSIPTTQSQTTTEKATYERKFE